MGQFIFFAILLCCLAAAFAVSALWQRAPALAVALALLVPAAAGGFYWHFGRPAALDITNTGSAHTLPEAITQLEHLSAAEPKDFEHAATLARAYAQAGRWGEAKAAYARAAALHDDPELSVEYAEALLRTSPDHRFPPEAVRLIESALKQDPKLQRALFFMGLYQRQNGQPAQAAQTLSTLLVQLDPADSAELRRQIAAARQDAGQPPATAQDGPLVKVSVDLDGKLAQMMGPGQVIFVMARRLEAGGPPVAVKRIIAKRYPLELTLSDEDSLMPTQSLSQQSEVVLSARISRSGDALPQRGDLESAPVTVHLGPGASGHLVINRIVP